MSRLHKRCRQWAGGMNFSTTSAFLAACWRHLWVTPHKPSVYAGFKALTIGGNLGAMLAGSCRQAATPFRVAATGGILVWRRG
jgi:hypothetical protein